jgi:putative hydrolase of the HAD superfamily
MELGALIFDMGNVLVYGDVEQIRAVLAGGSSSDVQLPVGYANWPQLERYARGQMTTIDFLQHLGNLTSRKIDPAEFDAAWASVFHLNSELAELIPPLSRKYKLALLSNTNDSHWRCCKEKLGGILNNFDALVLSFELGLLKPESEIFLTTAALVGQPPERCLFIDDIEEYVIAAQRSGLQAICYAGPETNSFFRSLL